MSISDIDRFGRLLNNLYTAVFERPQQKFNQPFRNVITAIESCTLEETTGDSPIQTVPVARAYASLTNTGYTSAGGFATTESITYGAGCCDETTMWLAIKLKPTYAYNACPVAKASVFEWSDDATHHLSVYFDQASTSWVVERQNGGSVVSASIIGNHAANDLVYLAVQWQSTQVSIARDAYGAWTTVAGTQIPTLAATTFRIGGGLGCGNFKLPDSTSLVALGTGTILGVSSALVFWLSMFAYIDQPGTQNPNLLAAPSFFWGGGTWSYLQSFFGTPAVNDHEASRVGECNAG